MGLSYGGENRYRIYSIHLVYGKEALLPVEVEMPAVKLLEKWWDPANDAFKERLLYMQKVQLDRMSALKHYE